MRLDDHVARAREPPPPVAQPAFGLLDPLADRGADQLQRGARAFESGANGVHALFLHTVTFTRRRDRAAELFAQDAANALAHALLAFDPVCHGCGSAP